ncbi:MAG: hypothetical protein GWP10_21745 [Nitrospiraceae bacterium]|nr:hypothetical protein [Nitrospiraceae bacterium]
MKDTKFKKIGTTLTAIALVTILLSSIVPVAAGVDEKIGVIVIAHGSPSESWCSSVRDAVDEVDLPYPVELGFLEFVPNETINLAVDRLDDAGVTKIIAVPLFVSSHSSHIQEIEYVLGLRETLPRTTEHVAVEGAEMERTVVSTDGRYVISRVPLEADADGDMRATGHPEEEEPLVPVETDAEIILAAAMDDHWLVAGIVADRTADLCVNPEGGTLVLVAHGTEEEANFAGWVNSTSSLADQARLKLTYWSDPAIELGGAEVTFIHHNETLHPEFTLRPVVENVTGPVVIPLMISEGYFTGRKIPGLLENLTYAYDGKALTPHPNVAKWIEISVAEESTDLTLRIYDESGDILDISLDDVGAAHGHICPCVAAAFKASQIAFSAWDGVPARGDLEIVSAHPSDGHIETFEYIINSSDDVTVELPEGTDTVNLTAENYNYRFIERSTGDTVVVSVKPDIFHDGFFELRTRCKTGVATPDEMSAFKLAKNELKEKILYLPAERVFEVEYTEGGRTSLTAEIIPAISMTVPTMTVDFGKVGAGMTSENQVIAVVNTGSNTAKVSAMLLDDGDGFYNESLRLNGWNIGGFSGVVPSDTSDFRHEYKILANLVVPDWAGGKYDGTILFVAESD